MVPLSYKRSVFTQKSLIQVWKTCKTHFLWYPLYRAWVDWSQLVGKIKCMICNYLYVSYHGTMGALYYIWLNEWGMIYHDEMNLVISWRNRNVVTIQTCLSLKANKNRPIGFYTYGSLFITTHWSQSLGAESL